MSKHTPGPWKPYRRADYTTPGWVILWPDTSKPGIHHRRLDSNGGFIEEDARLIAAAPDLLSACINARDMIGTDRQSFVDCQKLRDSRTDDPISHGLVAVEDGVWLDSSDAEVLRDYDRALAMIDAAIAKAEGKPC